MNSFKKQLILYADKVAIAISVILAILVLIAYIMTVGALSNHVEAALNPDGEVEALPEFDIETAKKLDLKGLQPGR